MYNVWYDMLEFADVAIGTGTGSLWRWVVVVVGERGRRQNAFGIWGWIKDQETFQLVFAHGRGRHLLASRGGNNDIVVQLLFTAY
jgi:hypothetical protein